MATVTGYVEKIKYRNDENGYSVLSVADGKEEYVLVGTFAYIAEGERIEATGRMVEHSIYGEQLSVESYEIKPPEDTPGNRTVSRLRCDQRHRSCFG